MSKRTPEQFKAFLLSLPEDLLNAFRVIFSHAAIIGKQLAQNDAPVRTGKLKASARSIAAVNTKTGVQSVFLFDVPYAGVVEDRAHFVERALETIAPSIVEGVRLAVLKTWSK